MSTYISQTTESKLKKAIKRIEGVLTEDEKPSVELNLLKDIVTKVDEKDRTKHKRDIYITPECIIALEWAICKMENLLCDSGNKLFNTDDELTEALEDIYKKALETQNKVTRPKF